MKEVKNTILQEESFQMNLHLHRKQLLLHLQLEHSDVHIVMIFIFHVFTPRLL